MSPIERAGHIAHSRSLAYQRRVIGSLDIIKMMLSVSDRPYVAFSIGKDSAVLLHLVTSLCPIISVRTLTAGETRILHSNWDDVLAWWLRERPLMDYQEICIDRVFSDHWQAASWADQRAVSRKDLRNEMPASGDFDGVFLGLTDEESNKRRMANKKGLIRQYSVNRTDNCAGMLCCCPLAYWTIADIAAYVVAHEIPMLSEYKNGFESRTTARITQHTLRFGGLQTLRLRDPDNFNKIISRFPELGEYSG